MADAGFMHEGATPTPVMHQKKRFASSADDDPSVLFHFVVDRLRKGADFRGGTPWAGPLAYWRCAFLEKVLRDRSRIDPLGHPRIQVKSRFVFLVLKVGSSSEQAVVLRRMRAPLR